MRIDRSGSRTQLVAKHLRWLLLSAAGILILAACSTNSASQPTPTSPVTIHISLDQTRVAAGTSINGQAVLTNTTSKSITVEQCAWDGWLWVGLENNRIQFKPAVETVACAPTVRLVPGANRFPITVMTTYQICTQSGGRSTTNVPPCSGTSGMPLLPAGTYKTKVVVSGLPSSRAVPPSIEVVLIAPR